MTFGAGSYGSVVYGGVVPDGAAIAVTPFPLCLTVTGSLEYNLDVSGSMEYDITVTGSCV